MSATPSAARLTKAETAALDWFRAQDGSVSYREAHAACGKKVMLALVSKGHIRQDTARSRYE